MVRSVKNLYVVRMATKSHNSTVYKVNAFTLCGKVFERMYHESKKYKKILHLPPHIFSANWLFYINIEVTKNALKFKISAFFA